MCISKLIFHMYKLQACSKSHGDEVQQILLAAYWCLLHSHLDEEPHQESLPPGQGKAWEGLPGAPKGQCQTNSTPASGKRGRWGGGGRISCWSPPVIFFHVVLWGWKYIHVEPRYLTRLLLLLRSGVVFEWLWNNSVAVSISRAPVSETGMMNSFWPHCTMYIVHI